MEAKYAREPARELKRAEYRQSPAKKDKTGRRLKRKKGAGIPQSLDIWQSPRPLVTYFQGDYSQAVQHQSERRRDRLYVWHHYVSRNQDCFV